MVQAPEETEDDELSLLRDTLETIHTNPVFRESALDLPGRFVELRMAVAAVAAHQYTEFRDSTPAPTAAAEHIMDLLRLLAWMRSALGRIDKRFRLPQVTEVDMAAWYIAAAAPLLMQDILSCDSAVETLLAQTDPPAQVAENEGNIRELFESTRELAKMHDAFKPVVSSASLAHTCGTMLRSHQVTFASRLLLGRTLCVEVAESDGRQNFGVGAIGCWSGQCMSR